MGRTAANPGTGISIKRVYAPPVPSDGYRVLVDRLWPRGLKRETAAIDEWVKSLAPSRALRMWFGHRSDRWPEFQRRYRLELAAPPPAAEIRRLRDLAATRPLTLLYAARNEAENHAQVLRELLLEGG